MVLIPQATHKPHHSKIDGFHLFPFFGLSVSLNPTPLKAFLK